MKRVRASDTSVMLGAVGAAGAVLLIGAVVASALVRSPMGPASAATMEAPTAATSAQAATTGAGNAATASQTAATTTAAAPSAPSRALTSSSPEVSPQVLVLAAERAPFDPTRQAPTGRYLFPEERVVPAPLPEPEPPPTPPFRVVGAIAGLPGAAPGSAGGVAVVQPDGQQPKILKVGDEFMGFRISSVEPDVVVASSRGWDVSIPVEGLQPTRMAAGGRNTRAAQARNQAANEAAREAERVLTQLRERFEALGGQAGNGNVTFEGQAGNGQFRFQMQDGRAIISGPNGQRQEIQIPGRAGGAGQGQSDVVIVAPGTRVVRPPGGGR